MCVDGSFRKDGLLVRMSSECVTDCCCFHYDPKTMSAEEVAKVKGLEDGFRVISNKGVNAGQTVMHFHMHVLGGKNLGENLI